MKRASQRFKSQTPREVLQSEVFSLQVKDRAFLREGLRETHSTFSRVKSSNADISPQSTGDVLFGCLSPCLLCFTHTLSTQLGRPPNTWSESHMVVRTLSLGFTQFYYTYYFPAFLFEHSLSLPPFLSLSLCPSLSLTNVCRAIGQKSSWS